MERVKPSSPDGRSMMQADAEWAWAPYAPSAERPWTDGLAAHLYRRAGFGTSWPGLERALALGPQASVDELIGSSSARGDEEADSAGWMAAAARSGNGETYVAWWLRRLLESRTVLRDKMTLFWHGHFAVGLGAVGDLPLFHRHVEALRSTALGGVEGLLRAQLNDPALWVALGGAQNRRSQPNLTFARPWLSQLTVGPELASETAVSEVARAFTGWFVYGGQLRWIEREHDSAEKRVFGRVGDLNRDDVLSVLALHRATFRNLAARLFRWFISETARPSEALLARLETLLAADSGILKAVETLLRSNLFYSREAVGQKVKSPVELVIGLGRAFEAVLPTQSMAQDLVRLGQRLDEPPTVQGWSGGVDWINSMTIAARQRWTLAVWGGQEGYGEGLDPWRLAVAHGCKTRAEAERRWQSVLLAGLPGNASGAAATGDPTLSESDSDPVKESVRRCLLDPGFQIN